MSAREWARGDVAVARINEWTGRVFFTGEVWMCEDGEGQWPTDSLDEVRPLVAIDPGFSSSSADELVRQLRIAANACRQRDRSEAETVCAWLATEVERQAGTPHVDEPGVWGVVEASCCHSDMRRNWIHHEDDNWWPAETYSHAEHMVAAGRDPRLPDGWDDLVDPVLVRGGVSS